MKKTVLITNDDGVFSPALKSIKDTLEKKYNVVVVVPDRERSAISMAMTIHQPLRAKKIEEDFYIVDGYPVDCVNLGVINICKTKPDFVLSGMNMGENIGIDVFYSGTVAAAFAGHLLEIPSMAVSLLSSKEGPNSGEFDYVGGSEITSKVLKKIVDEPFKSCVYNLNIPFGCNGEVLLTRPGGKKYFTSMEEKDDPRGSKLYWVGGGQPTYSEDKTTDAWAVKNGYASFSVLKYDISDNCLGEPGKKIL